jgi:hypothetical protein
MRSTRTVHLILLDLIIYFGITHFKTITEYKQKFKYTSKKSFISNVSNHGT